MEPNICKKPTRIRKFSSPYRLNSATINVENKQLIPKKRKEIPENSIKALVNQ
jgi:hypothetical protein